MYRRRKKTLYDRFDERYQPEPNSGCWLWLGALNTSGYGKLGDGAARHAAAHRLSYSRFNGEIPTGAHVLHTCDVTGCVNPDHLYLGTHNDNMRDKVIRNRQSFLSGEKQPNAKFTDEIVREILASSLPAKDLSTLYGVDKSSVWKVRANKSWKHIPRREVLTG